MNSLRVVWDAIRTNTLVDYCKSIAELRAVSEEAVVELEATYMRKATTGLGPCSLSCVGITIEMTKRGVNR